MSFSDLFDSGFKDRNKSHFESIVRVALSDGAITAEEKTFLDRVAIRLEISEQEYQEILENPTKYPINPPVLHVQRLERLYDLSRMVYADHILGPKQHAILTRFDCDLSQDLNDPEMKNNHIYHRPEHYYKQSLSKKQKERIAAENKKLNK